VSRAGPVDVQTHFLPPTMVSVLEVRDQPPHVVTHDGMRLVEYADGAAYPLVPAMTDLGRKLADMDAGGVGASVLSVNIPGIDWFNPADAPHIARAVNDELVDLVASHPDRLAALAALPMQVPEAAAAEVERATGKGLHGLMLYSNVAGRALDEPAFRPVFAAAASTGAPLLIHPTYPLSAPSLDAYALVPVVGFLFDTSTATLRLILDGLFDRHPDLQVILGHVGGVLPYIVGRIDYESGRIPGGTGALTTAPSEHLRKLHVDTVSAWPPAMGLAIDFFGADRVLWASDHPFWDPNTTHEALAALKLAPGVKQAIEIGNATRLLGLETPAD
jgi:predicted TIM-barrel fold metal-dependent hydrolase